MITKELIKQIVDDYKGSDIADHLYRKLKLIEEVQAGLKITRKLINDENIKYDKTVKELKGCIKDWQKKCEHWSKTYHPDPSGNNDSFYECNICGKEL
jgi:hypothetical protein